MVTETKTTEQADGAEKQVLDALLETEEAKSVLEAEPEAVPEVEGEKPAKTFSQEELEAELEKRVSAEANSRTAKSLVTYQKTQDALKKEIAELKKERDEEKREAELAKLEGRELEELGDTPEVRSIQATRRELAKQSDAIKNDQMVFDGALAAAKVDWLSNTKFRLAIKYGLENGEEVIKQLDSFVKELGDGDEEKLELRAKLASVALKEPPKKAPKLDSSRLSAPGGRDFRTATPADKVAEQMKRDRNKK